MRPIPFVVSFIAFLVSLVILTLCGTAVGYGWYRAMRWQFERMGMLRRNDDAEQA